MSRAIVERQLSAEAKETIPAAMQRIRTDPKFIVLQQQPMSKIRDWLERALGGLAMWDSGADFSTVMHVYIDLGREGQQHGIPPKELLGVLAALADARGAQRCGEEWESGIYLQSALKPLDTFCDFAKYYLIRGYQDSSR